MQVYATDSRQLPFRAGRVIACALLVLGLLAVLAGLHFQRMNRASRSAWVKANPDIAVKMPTSPSRSIPSDLGPPADHPHQITGADEESLESEQDESSDNDSPDSDWLSRLRSFPTGHIPAGARLRAFNRWTQMSADLRSAQAGGMGAPPQWTFLGPLAETGVQAGFGTPGPCSGRVTAIAISATDPNTIYIGGADGGIWMTTNAGATNVNWTALTDSQPSLSVGAIAIDPSNAQTIYVGTGEQNHSHDEYSGVGILKSSDGGSS
jgi:hypothetical protein